MVLVCTGIRAEEKLLLGAFEKRDAPLRIADDREIGGNLGSWPEGLPRADVVLLRSKSHWRNVVLARWLAHLGVRTVNAPEVLETCGDKIRTTLALHAAGVPAAPASVAFTPQGGARAGEALGFPLVVKPAIGSWGRLVGRVNDADALETVLEHKEALGGAPHAVPYLQPYYELGGRDLRSFVVGDRCVAAIARSSTHWRTNTALGASASAFEVDDALASVSEAAARAVGGGVVAVDLFETDDGYVVNEVNGTMEFRNSVDTTGVDIPGLVADWVVTGAGRAAGVDSEAAP